MVAWTLGMKKCKLSIALHHFKMKVVKLHKPNQPPLKIIFLGTPSGIDSNVVIQS